MAIKGLRLPYYALYNYDETSGAATYSDGGKVGKAVDYAVKVTRSDDNHLWADDGIAETEKGKFQSGELTLTTSSFSQELSKVLLGLKEKTVTVGEGTVTVNVYDDDAESPDIGFGIIEWHQVLGVDKFRAIVLLRSYFSIPEDAATTRGESVEWKTKQITGVIQRSEVQNEDENHPWKYEAWLDTAAEAETFLKAVLSISAGV